jgi:hypothetical protein
MNAHQIKLWITCAIGILISLFMAVLIGSGEIESVIVCLSGFFVLIWTMFGTRIWWLPVPFFATLGGVFQHSFKIQPAEIGILISLFAATPLIVTKRYGIASTRPPIPFCIKLFTGYLCLHLMGSLIYNKYIGIDGPGNTVRGYMTFLWPMLFIFLFYLYGDSRQLNLGFWAMFVAGLMRLLMGLYVQFSGRPVEIPGVGYVGPAFGEMGESGIVVDLRASGYIMVVMSVMAFVLVKNAIARVFIIAVFVTAVVASLYGGGRTGFVNSAIIVLCLIVLYRKWSLLVASMCGFIVFVVLINASPTILNPLPYGAQRVAQLFMFSKIDVSEASNDTLGSDEYSIRLRELGWKNWTDSPSSILFGKGIRSFEQLPPSAAFNGSLMFEMALENAAKVGTYESGVWSVLAVIGLVGALLYMYIFYYFIRGFRRDLWQNRISNYNRAFAFFGVASLIAWCVGAYRSNGVPVFVLLYCFLGWVAWVDMQRLSRSKNLPDKGAGRLQDVSVH